MIISCHVKQNLNVLFSKKNGDESVVSATATGSDVIAMQKCSEFINMIAAFVKTILLWWAVLWLVDVFVVDIAIKLLNSWIIQNNSWTIFFHLHHFNSITYFPSTMLLEMYIVRTVHTYLGNAMSLPAKVTRLFHYFFFQLHRKTCSPSHVIQRKRTISSFFSVKMKQQSTAMVRAHTCFMPPYLDQFIPI